MDNILSNYGYKYIYVLLNRINSIYVLIYCSANKHCLIPVSYPVILLDVVSCITILKSANKKKQQNNDFCFIFIIYNAKEMYFQWFNEIWVSVVEL